MSVPPEKISRSERNWLEDMSSLSLESWMIDTGTYVNARNTRNMKREKTILRRIALSAQTDLIHSIAACIYVKKRLIHQHRLRPWRLSQKQEVVW